MSLNVLDISTIVNGKWKTYRHEVQHIPYAPIDIGWINVNGRVYMCHFNFRHKVWETVADHEYNLRQIRTLSRHIFTLAHSGNDFQQEVAHLMKCEILRYLYQIRMLMQFETTLAGFSSSEDSLVAVLDGAGPHET